MTFGCDDYVDSRSFIACLISVFCPNDWIARTGPMHTYIHIRAAIAATIIAVTTATSAHAREFVHGSENGIRKINF